jgi:hypothetical protein
MSGKFITLSVNRLITGGGSNWRTGEPYPYKVYDFGVNNQNTYITIFSIDQIDQFKQFKELFKGNILFISKPAVNGRKSHGKQPRNTIVVYEPVSTV